MKEGVNYLEEGIVVKKAEKRPQTQELNGQVITGRMTRE